MADQQRPPKAWRILARLLPAWYADRYGSDIWQTHADAHAPAARGLSFWLVVTWDVVLTSLQLRGEAVLDKGRKPRENPVSTLWFDLHMAMRKTVRRPGFSLAVVLLIALGVGSVTAVFTIVQQLLLAPPPLIQQPEQIVRLEPAADGDIGAATYADYMYYRDNARVFSDVFGYDGGATMLQLRTEAGTAEVEGRFVTGNFFSALRVAAAHGRMLTPDDDHEHAPSAVMIAPSLRERLFGTRDPLGATLMLNGHAFTVVGLVPQQFRGPAHDDMPVELWLPVWKRSLVTGWPREHMERVPGLLYPFLTVMARVAPDATLERARANATQLGTQLERTYEDARGAQVTLMSDFDMSPQRRETVVLLSRLIGGLSVIVLIIVCANLGNLMLARALARRAEANVRLALGAGRARLIREAMLETLLLALVGGVAGLGLAVLGARGLTAFMSFRMATSPTPDGRVVAFALALALLSAVVCAIAPALIMARGSTGQVSGARVTGGGAAARTALVIAQVALCFVLLAGATLFTRTLGRVHAVELGFNPRGVLALAFDLRAHGYDPTTAPLVYDRLRERIAALPGVQSTALGSVVPLSGGRRTSSIEIEGRPTSGPELTLDNNLVSPGYFTTMQTRIVRGRDFTAADNDDSPPVLIINETMAQRYWPQQVAIGKRVGLGNREWEVVGVVADTRTTNVTQPPVPMFYRPFAQAFFSRMQIYVRTSGDALALVPSVRAAIAEIDPDIVPRSVAALDRVHADRIRTFTVNARLFAILAVVALLLASMGLYAVTSYLVARRTREFGLRMAIGAQAGDVLRDVLGGALQRGAIGVVIGALTTIALVPAVERFLFELSPLDPAAFLWAGVPLLIAVLFASGLPARRAVRIEPVAALRTD
jgi:predicted permease